MLHLLRKKRLEETLIKLVRRFVKTTGEKNVTLSGGVALNCKANGRIWNEVKEINDLYVVPLAPDDGIGIGANMAYAQSRITQNRGDFVLPNVFLGPAFSPNEISNILKNFQMESIPTEPQQQRALAKSLRIEVQDVIQGMPIEELNELISKDIRRSGFSHDDVEQSAASALSEGSIIAWFQGPMEAGPRALGNRSILADPRSIKNLLKVNEKVKYRQPWRPFCPSVLDEFKDIYFENTVQSQYMINTFSVHPIGVENAPAIVHVDGTARPQFVKKNECPKFHKLLTEFHKLTNVPILLNTSMNIKGEPICCTPYDAIKFYYLTGVDMLFIGDNILQKAHPDLLG